MNAKRTKLGDREIADALKSLPGWSVAAGKLHRDYAFPDFITAFGFMTSAAIVVQSLDHHPEWSNVYHKVSVDLVTHDAGGITGMDVDLAGRMEALASRLLPKS